MSLYEWLRFITVHRNHHGLALVRLLFLLCQARLELRSELGEGRHPFHASTRRVYGASAQLAMGFIT